MSLKSSEEQFDAVMPFSDHLADLRGAMIRGVLMLVVAFGVTFHYSDVLVAILERPIFSVLPEGQRFLYFSGVADKFLAHVKVSMLAAVMVAGPWMAIEIWRFVAPGLTRGERRYFWPFALAVGFGFSLGAYLAYEFMLPAAFSFLLDFGSAQDRPLITMGEYFSLTLSVMVVSGLVFQLPLVMALLGRLGIVSPAFLRRYRGHALVANAILSMIITPTTDPFSMILVMIPIAVLYELGIMAVVMMGREAG